MPEISANIAEMVQSRDIVTVIVKHMWPLILTVCQN